MTAERIFAFHKASTALGLHRMQKIVEKAEQLNVHVALENLHNFADLSYILEQTDSPHIGFCYDCCHPTTVIIRTRISYLFTVPE